MDCREVESKLGDLSAEALAQATSEEIEQHLAKCPPCAREWDVYQRSLFSLSTTSQPLLTEDKSREMWSCCQKYIEAKTDRELASRRAPWWQVWWQPRRSPVLGWASLGAAVAILAAVVLANPTRTNYPVRIADNNPKTEWIRFQTPPREAATFINHHATMGFDPFSDRVGTTLVSDSAISPAMTVSAPASDQ